MSDYLKVYCEKIDEVWECDIPEEGMKAYASHRNNIKKLIESKFPDWKPEYIRYIFW